MAHSEPQSEHRRSPSHGRSSQSSSQPAGVDPQNSNIVNGVGRAAVNSPPVSRFGVTSLATAQLPTRFGDFQITVVRIDGSCEQALILTRGDLTGEDPPLVRLHSECLTGEVLGSLRCDCGEQLASALGAIAREGRGVLIYLYQEGRGIGLVNKIRAYALQDHGLDTVEANLALGLPVDGRDYSGAAAIIRSLGISRVRLLTNNPDKCLGVERHDVQVVERVPLVVAGNPANLAYLQTKVARMGHVLDLSAPTEHPSDRAPFRKDQAA